MGVAAGVGRVQVVEKLWGTTHHQNLIVVNGTTRAISCLVAVLKCSDNILILVRMPIFIQVLYEMLPKLVTIDSDATMILDC